MIKEKCSMMVEIIPNKPVSHRRLWRHGQQGRMGIDRSHHRVEAGIRDAPHTYLSVIVGYIFYQPIDCIISVCTLIFLFRRHFIRDEWSNVNKITLGQIFTPHILIDKNKFIFGKIQRRPKTSFVEMFTIRPDTIGCAL